MRVIHGWVLGAVMSLTQPAAAQGFRMIVFDGDRTELPHEFTKIAQVFELRDGRVVVVDRLAAEVLIGDFAAARTAVVGRTGDGPGEYRNPLNLIPLGGDSVGVYDDANVRIMVINSAGSVAGFTTPFSVAEGTRIYGLVGDGGGFLYGEQRSRSSDDSASLFRWKVATNESHFVTRIHRPAPEGAQDVGGGTMRPGSFAKPDTRNMWAVDSSGWLGIAVFNPYHVELTLPSGQRVTGPSIPYARIPVNDSVKRAFIADRPKGVSGMIVSGKTGKQTTVFEPVFPLDPSLVTWAKEVPPFRGDAFVAFAPDGSLWIQRTTFGREGARYDIIGRDGKLADRVGLPEGYQVVGFGREAMYVVRRDADDLEYLQRRPFPRR